MDHKKTKEKSIDIKTIVTAALGGILLLITSSIFSVFFSTPPTRAEFNEFKIQTKSEYQSISDRLTELKGGQDNIYNHLLKKDD